MHRVRLVRVARLLRGALYREKVPCACAGSKSIRAAPALEFATMLSPPTLESRRRGAAVPPVGRCAERRRHDVVRFGRACRRRLTAIVVGGRGGRPSAGHTALTLPRPGADAAGACADRGGTERRAGRRVAGRDTTGTDAVRGLSSPPVSRGRQTPYPLARSGRGREKRRRARGVVLPACAEARPPFFARPLLSVGTGEHLGTARYGSPADCRSSSLPWGLLRPGRPSARAPAHHRGCQPRGAGTDQAEQRQGMSRRRSLRGASFPDVQPADRV